jgi:uncharacterized lipoprotein YmbA
MMPTLRTHLLLAALTLIAAQSSGCASHDPSPTSLYALDPGKPTVVRDASAREAAEAGGRGAISPDRVIEIRRVAIAPPFDGVALTFRTHDGTYVKDAYNQWVAPPEELFSTEMTDWLAAAACAGGEGGAFASVIDPRSAAPHRWALETSITSLYGDFQNRNEPRVILRARVFLLDKAAGSGRIAYQNRYDITLPLESASPHELVRGTSRAYREFLESITRDLWSYRKADVAANTN